MNTTENTGTESARADSPATHGSAPERQYYILSLKHSPADGCALWWLPKCAGYTKNLLDAGKYPESEVSADPDYFNDGTATRAVACDAVETSIVITVDWNTIKKAINKVQND